MSSRRSVGSSTTPESFLLSNMELASSYDELAELRDDVEPKLRPGPLDEKEDVSGDDDGSDGPSREDP